MPNKLQKVIWIVTGASPLLLTISVAHYFTYHNKWFVFGSAALIILSYSIFSKMLNNHLKLLPIQQIVVSGIRESDGRAYAAILTYLLPLASIVFKNYNLQMIIGVTVIAFLILLLTNVMTFNPFVLIKGYNYFEASATSGVQNYTIISKRKLKKNNSISEVIMLTDYFLIDNRRVS